MLNNVQYIVFIVVLYPCLYNNSNGSIERTLKRGKKMYSKYEMRNVNCMYVYIDITEYFIYYSIYIFRIYICCNVSVENGKRKKKFKKKQI